MKLSSKIIDKELNKRAAVKANPPQFLDPQFTSQTEFIQDPSTLKAVLCTRRSGKSYGAGLYLFKEAYENPGVSVLYIGLTRETAKKIMVKDVLKPINKRLKLHAKFNETLLTFTLPNGSVIYLMGADSSEDEKDKLLGQKYKLAIIDEGASFSINMHELVYGTLKPGTIDLLGTICIMSAPSNLIKGLFFDITNGKEQGWKLFKWSALDNPYMREQWLLELADIKATRPLFMETPLFKQHYLGQWVIDETKLVYKYDSARNSYQDLPKLPLKGWNFLLGVDLGYDDASAFSVVTFHENDPTLYVSEVFKQSKMDITDVATKIKEIQSRYEIQRIVVDGANKQAVEEMRKRHSIPLQSADKSGKWDFIQLMNAEFIQGLIKLHTSCGPLADEYLGLIKNERSLKPEEHPACENHLCDSTLYIWRYAYTYLSRPAKTPSTLTRREQWIAASQAMAEQSLEDQILREQAEESNDLMFMDGDPFSDQDVLKHYLNKRKI